MAVIITSFIFSLSGKRISYFILSPSCVKTISFNPLEKRIINAPFLLSSKNISLSVNSGFSAVPSFGTDEIDPSPASSPSDTTTSLSLYRVPNFSASSGPITSDNVAPWRTAPIMPPSPSVVMNHFPPKISANSTTFLSFPMFSLPSSFKMTVVFPTGRERWLFCHSSKTWSTAPYFPSTNPFPILPSPSITFFIKPGSAAAILPKSSLPAAFSCAPEDPDK